MIGSMAVGRSLTDERWFGRSNFVDSDLEGHNKNQYLAMEVPDLPSLRRRIR